VSNTDFERNTVNGNGGGLHAVNATLAMTGSTFTQNHAHDGGGMALMGEAESTVTNTVFTGNEAQGEETFCDRYTFSPEERCPADWEASFPGAGGAAYLGCRSAAFTNTAFLNNTATHRGGGVAVDEEVDAVLTNVSFARNEATGFTEFCRGPGCEQEFEREAAGEGGALFRENGIVEIVNAIVWGNGDEVAGGSGIDIRYSCVKGGAPDSFDRGNNLSGCGPAEGEGPYTSAGNGDLHLKMGAAAIDAGDNDAPGLTGVDTDVEGNPRFVGTVDLGAYERQ
jgi:predicted outer membrane repeat protein